MGKLILGILAALQIYSGSSLATTVEIPIEISALLQQKQFQRILQAKTQEARESGRTLVVSSFRTLNAGAATFVYTDLNTRSSANLHGDLTLMGSIVGSVVYGPLGEVTFDGVYFKSSEGVPIKEAADSVCESGKLPSRYQGTYKTPTSNTRITLTADKVMFEGLPKAYLNLASCEVDGKRVVTLTDQDPATTQNLVFELLRNGDLRVSEFGSQQSEIWVRN